MLGFGPTLIERILAEMVTIAAWACAVARVIPRSRVDCIGMKNEAGPWRAVAPGDALPAHQARHATHISRRTGLLLSVVD